MMKHKLLIALAALPLLASCGSTSQALYYWGGWQNNVTKYEDLAYKEYKNQTPEATCRLVCLYEDMVSNPGGTRQVPPPGICAEYGYLLLQSGTADTFASKATDAQKKMFGTADYASLFYSKGQQMFEKEIEYYPESAIFLKPLIQKFTGR